MRWMRKTDAGEKTKNTVGQQTYQGRATSVRTDERMQPMDRWYVGQKQVSAVTNVWRLYYVDVQQYFM